MCVQSNKEQAEALLAATTTMLSEVSATLTQADNDYNTGALALQDCNILIDRGGAGSGFFSLPVDAVVAAGVDLTGLGLCLCALCLLEAASADFRTKFKFCSYL